MFKVIRHHGKANLVRVSDGACVPHTFDDFIKWHNALPPEEKLDLSDQPPAPPVVDVDLERVREIVSKPIGGIAEPEFKEAVVKFIRRRL